MGLPADLTTCITSDDGSELLPLSPFYALRYHFGMLLGVDDFETEQAYHRAKMRLHNAWLHRQGVVWGFNVIRDDEHNEIRVTSGFALDSAGHELHLEGDACLNIVSWLAKHESDPDFKRTISTDRDRNTLSRDGDEKTFDAHVIVKFKACLTRQVPAMLEPCDSSSTGTAYSRVYETVEICLLPGLAPRPEYPYHRLRLFYGIDPPKLKDGKPTEADQEVLDKIEEIQSLETSKERRAACLKAFHLFAALDEIDLKPAMSDDGARRLLFPGHEDDPVVLANIRDITLKKKDKGWSLTGGRVDVSVRPSHVATTTIQDLLCGRCLCADEKEEPRRGIEIPSLKKPPLIHAANELPSKSIGPRVDPDSLDITDTEIKLAFDKPLHPASVTAGAFSVTIFREKEGWTAVTIARPPIVDETRKTVSLKFAKQKSKLLIRVVAHGTGPRPILGEDLLPLAGATTDDGLHQGADFVAMKKYERR